MYNRLASVLYEEHDGRALKHTYLHIGTMPVDNVCLVLFWYIINMFLIHFIDSFSRHKCYKYLLLRCFPFKGFDYSIITAELNYRKPALWQWRTGRRVNLSNPDYNNTISLIQTVKPALSRHLIKRTISITRTVAQVPKSISLIYFKWNLYQTDTSIKRTRHLKSTWNGHLYCCQPVLNGRFHCPTCQISLISGQEPWPYAGHLKQGNQLAPSRKWSLRCSNNHELMTFIIRDIA